MSDTILQTLIITAGGFAGLFSLLLFTGTTSAFDRLVDAWKETRLAKLKIEEARQLHERHCPRLTDTPRKP